MKWRLLLSYFPNNSLLGDTGGKQGEKESLITRNPYSLLVFISTQSVKSPLMPLIIAAQSGKPQAVRFLIGKGTDPYSKDNNGRNSFHCASFGDQFDVIEQLVLDTADDFC